MRETPDYTQGNTRDPRNPPTPLPPGEELANDAGDNACFGCGPDNPIGLHLRFFDDGDVVRAPLILDERHASWRGMANMGIVATAMLEAGSWALWERLGPSRIAGDITLHAEGFTRLDAPTTVEARVVPEENEARVEARCVQAGEEVARAHWRAARMAPEQAKRMLADAAVPRSLREGFEERAKRSPPRAPSSR